MKIKRQTLYILLWSASIIITALSGIIIGYNQALIDNPTPNMDCGTLIMRQQIKGWDGYIDVPYNLNQFRNNPYEEEAIWSNSTIFSLKDTFSWNNILYIWSNDENIFYTYFPNGTYKNKVNILDIGKE